MAISAIEFFVIALFSSAKMETNGQIITVPVELYTTVGLSCMCPICPESTAIVQWYRISSSDAFIEDGRALAWWSVGRNGSLQGFGIKDDFSMIIHNLTDPLDQDLYRCIVSPVGGAAECTHDVKLLKYANPVNSPVIEYIREADGLKVTCSTINVFPIIYPLLTPRGRNEPLLTNQDGTYNTTVTRSFSSNEKDTTIECLHSYLNFRSKASLRIVGSDTFDQPEEEDSMDKNETHIDYGCTLTGVWMVWTILIIELVFVIAIVYAIKSGRVILDPSLRKTIREKTEDHGRNVEEEEPAKSEKTRLFGKLSCGVTTFTIRITLVVVLLVAYLATARCLNEGSGKLY